MGKLTDAQINEAQRRYEEGESAGAIAWDLSVTRQSVWALLKRRGVQMRPQRRYGADNHFYKGGGRKKTERGYIRVYINGRWRYEHRVIMEQIMGRALLPNEETHHRNLQRDDNRPENLELQTHSRHLSLHKTGHIVSEEAKHRQSAKLLGRWLRPEITVEHVTALRQQGYSLNRIALHLGLSWGGVWRRVRYASHEQSSTLDLPRG